MCRSVQKNHVSNPIPYRAYMGWGTGWSQVTKQLVSTNCMRCANLHIKIMFQTPILHSIHPNQWGGVWNRIFFVQIFTFHIISSKKYWNLTPHPLHICRKEQLKCAYICVYKDMMGLANPTLYRCLGKHSVYAKPHFYRGSMKPPLYVLIS